MATTLQPMTSDPSDPIERWAKQGSLRGGPQTLPGVDVSERPWNGPADAKSFLRQPTPAAYTPPPVDVDGRYKLRGVNNGQGSASIQAGEVRGAAQMGAPPAGGGVNTPGGAAQLDKPTGFRGAVQNARNGLRGTTQFLTGAGESAGSVGGAIKSVGGGIASGLRAAMPFAKVLGAPMVAADAINTSFNTPTEQYRKRFGLETDDPSLLGDVGVRALGIASDLGDSPTGGFLGRHLYRDKQPDANQPVAPVNKSATATNSVASPAPDAYPQANAAHAARGLRQGPMDDTVNPYHGDLTPQINSAMKSGRTDLASTGMRANDIYKTKSANGTTSYSGYGDGSGAMGNIVGGDGRQLRAGGTVSSVPGMSKELIKQTLTNPDGSNWSAADNLTMAANLRDGVDKYRGTSRDTRGAGADKYANMPIKTAAAMRVADAQAASQMATTQANNAVTREGNQMHLDAAMAPMRYAAQQRKLAGELLTQTGGDLGAATKLAMRHGVDPTHLQSAWSTDTTNRTAEQNMGDKARDGMAKEFLAYDPTGKANDDLSARRFAAVQKIMPGADLMSTEGRSKNLPEMQTLAKIFDRVSGSPQMGLDKINPLVPKGAARDAMPDLKGAKLVRQGLAGAITPGSSPNGYYLQTANGDVPLGADLSERELEIIRYATETGNWRGAPKKTQ